jgi:hypothetical protein
MHNKAKTKQALAVGRGQEADAGHSLSEINEESKRSNYLFTLKKMRGTIKVGKHYGHENGAGTRNRGFDDPTYHM